MPDHKTAFQNLNARALTESEIMSHYCLRPQIAGNLESSAQLLENTVDPRLLFLSGCRGTGKTTELKRLSERLRDTYSVIFVGSGELLMCEELATEDVLLVFLTSLASSNAAHGPGRNILPTVLKQLGVPDSQANEERWYQYIQSLRYYQRGEREKLRRATTVLFDAVCELAGTISQATGKRILMVADDFDRLTPDVVGSLFGSSSHALRRLPFSIVGTVPLTTFFSSRENVREHIGTAECLLPVRIRSKDDKPYSVGRSFLIDVLEKRISIDLFDQEALDIVLRASGGVIRQLLGLASECVLEMSIVGNRVSEGCITPQIAKKAVRRASANYGRLLTKADRDFLRNVAVTKSFSIEQEQGIHHLLLGAVLQYRDENGACSFDVNPLVAPQVSLEV